MFSVNCDIFSLGFLLDCLHGNLQLNLLNFSSYFHVLLVGLNINQSLS